LQEGHWIGLAAPLVAASIYFLACDECFASDSCLLKSASPGETFQRSIGHSYRRFSHKGSFSFRRKSHLFLGQFS
jgi:hypothetical protein